MNIIIPMSGTGKRFQDAGYRQIKPLIPVEGKPIIQHIIERFGPSDNFILICNEVHLAATELAQVLKKICPQARIIPIKAHKFGPVYAVMRAESHIINEQPVIVNYCDFSWRWDYADFKDTVAKNRCDGCILAYRGFHPHLLGPDYYASVKLSEGNWLEEIKEKYSFTADKMESFQSSGTYYFAKGAYIKKYFPLLMQRNIDISGEYYVSLVYNLMKEDNLKVFVYEIPYFLQWGTPQDLEDYLYWSDYFHAPGANRQ